MPESPEDLHARIGRVHVSKWGDGGAHLTSRGTGAGARFAQRQPRPPWAPAGA